jgi:hypothetical protein
MALGTKFARVSALAKSKGMSRFWLYDLIRRQIVPLDAVERVGGGILVNVPKFEALIAEGRINPEPRIRRSSVTIRRMKVRGNAGHNPRRPRTPMWRRDLHLTMINLLEAMARLQEAR